MPLDNEHTAKAADYRKYAAGDFMDAAKYAMSGDLWMANHKAAEGARWVKYATELEKETADAARVEAECAAFDAAIAECPHAA